MTSSQRTFTLQGWTYNDINIMRRLTSTFYEDSHNIQTSMYIWLLITQYVNTAIRDLSGSSIRIAHKYGKLVFTTNNWHSLLISQKSQIDKNIVPKRPQWT